MLTACQSDTNSKRVIEEDVYDGDIINDESIAKEYADLLMSNTLQKNIKEYKIVDVSFDPNKDIWTVSYCIDDYTLGGDINIAISKDSGEIKKIWYGE